MEHMVEIQHQIHGGEGRLCGFVNTQKSHFVRRQPNAAVPKAPSFIGHSDVEEFRQLGTLLVFLGEAELAVAHWRKSWLSTARMECMTKVIDGSGDVDQARMHVCNAKNSADHNFTSDKRLNKAMSHSRR